ncbi:hypothetical protein PMAYCL1PPCAC_29836 [Pristionchus mayeri]|uniref:Uncharacterized protein n=1 Tax=Pristionchus mayeri TaxID=1317129 RepID=A0AAN5IEJ6_9BILA|nr:hypothetical protein PMAYCL1PPCAC_29836 [Pristionchus mayeri]
MESSLKSPGSLKSSFFRYIRHESRCNQRYHWTMVVLNPLMSTSLMHPRMCVCTRTPAIFVCSLMDTQMEVQWTAGTPSGLSEMLSHESERGDQYNTLQSTLFN